MKSILLLTLSLFISHSAISTADEFTLATYNCGGLSDHYDYLRGVSMQKLMQERYTAESKNMALNEKIQQTALKILFSNEPAEKKAAEKEWNDNGYQSLFELLTATPAEANSPNTLWNQKVDQIITSYKIRPVIIHDEEVKSMLADHINDLTKGKKDKKAKINDLLNETRSVMAKRIFSLNLKHDIICLQEADYLDSSSFPEHYEALLSESFHSVNGVVWNKDRFKLVENLGSIMGRAFVVKLQDVQSGKTVLVASGHLSGCNPYKVENNDSARGDNELKTVIALLDANDADIKIIGMDSNVTSLHPRLNLLKDADYSIDYNNFIEPTCTNPYQVLNTRIDWITVKKGSDISITNIPVLNVGLNSMQTNISDHKPIAAKIVY